MARVSQPPCIKKPQYFMCIVVILDYIDFGAETPIKSSALRNVI